jgi:hypothetical protein
MKFHFAFFPTALFLGSVFAREEHHGHRKLAVLKDEKPIIPEAYMVVFNDYINETVKDSLFDTVEMFGGIITQEYHESFYGIAIQDASGELLDEILEHPDVERVVPVSK